MTNAPPASQSLLVHSGRSHASQRVQADSQPLGWTAFRWVNVAIAMSLLWKSRYYPAAYQLYRDVEVIQDFFPVLFRDHLAIAGFTMLPLLSAALIMVLRNQWAAIGHAFLMVVCMAGLCWHQGSYNDATFLTCFWASLWCLWLACSLHRPEVDLMADARRFAMMTVSLMFLGGAVGKLTPGYWSGEVLYQLYFVDRDFWFFNLLRQQLDGESLRAVATGYSRMVILVELGGAMLWVLPTRWGGALALATLTGIAVFSNFNLFSVMCSLLGLCLVAMTSPRDAA